MTHLSSQDEELLNSIIFGREEPHIYAFTTPDIPGYLKVGDTQRRVSLRMQEWRAHYPHLTLQWQASAMVPNKEAYFRDYDVHLFLTEDKQRQRLTPQECADKYYSREFFRGATTNDVEEAVEDIRKAYPRSERYTYYTSTGKKHTEADLPRASYEPRPNQQEVIENFKKAVGAGRTQLLMFAVMRFGKSFTAMCCALTLKKADMVVVLSGKKDTEAEWKATVNGHQKFADYTFLTAAELKTELSSGKTALKALSEKHRKIVLFLTLQDLNGKEIKPHHHDLFGGSGVRINLLIVDETHFGARAAAYGKVLGMGATSEKKSDKQPDLEELDAALKILRPDVTLHLSGTPYRILMSGEFRDEDIICSCSFEDIAEAQLAWDEANSSLPAEQQQEEWMNPYFGFPQMVRFAFNLNDSSRILLKNMREEGISAGLNELFSPRSIQQDTAKRTHCQFTHEREVSDFLRAIDGSEADTEVLGFLDYRRIKEGALCRHIVMVLPYCASCDAMEKLLHSHREEFRHLGEYDIINIAGYDARFKQPNSVRNHIRKCEEKGTKTLSLTVNKMLTGTTVQEWDTMLFLKAASSPQEYDQAIFRLQNPYTVTYREKGGNGKTYVVNKKPQTLLVDFAPERVFFLQQQKALFFNIREQGGGNDVVMQRLEREIRFSPLITREAGKLEQITAANILDKVSEYSKERSVLDESYDLPADFNILEHPEIRAAIMHFQPLNAAKGIFVRQGEGEGQEVEIPPAAEGEQQNEPRHGDSDAAESPQKPADEEKTTAQRIATYYALILFYACLSESSLHNLKELIADISANDNNRRIAANLGLKTNILHFFLEKANPRTLCGLDTKIANISARLMQDENLSPVERAMAAMKKLGRLSDTEVVLPEQKAREIVDFLPLGAVTPQTRILDISSKQGEFALAFYRKFGDSLLQNFYAIPSSSVSYEFTRLVFRRLGMPESHVLEHIVPSGMDENRYLLQKIDYQKEMQFDIIVGNPPYQESISRSQGNSSLSKQVFPQFVKKVMELEPRYAVLVTPSRWFAADAQDKSFVKLRDYLRANNHIAAIRNYPSDKEVFEGVDVGAINYFLYDREHRGDVEFSNYVGKQWVTEIRPLFFEGVQHIISRQADAKLISLLHTSPHPFTPLSDHACGRNAFNICGKRATLHQMTHEAKQEGDYTVRCAYEEIRYISPDKICKNKALADSWKVLISKGNGAAGTLGGGKPAAILGKPYVGAPQDVCTDSLIPIGCFKTKEEAEHLSLYLRTKFVRYLVGLLKVSQNLYRNVYEYVPCLDFSDTNPYINWNASVSELDKQLYHFYQLDNTLIDHIESQITPA